MESAGVRLEDLLRQTREALETLRQARGDSADEGSGNGSTGPVSVGEACEGQIRAEVVDGRLQALTVDPRLIRVDPDRVCEHVREAVNQALDGADSSLAMGSVVDMDALAQQLCQIQEESMVGMERIGREMDTVLQRLRQAGR